jgi:hypothetical protein
MRAALDWLFRAVAFAMLLRALWSELRGDFLPAVCVLAFGTFLICAVTPNAWGERSERKRDDTGPG